MKRWRTKYTNNIGVLRYPIYLLIFESIVDGVKINTYDLECEYEIYALAWYDIYEESVKEYENEQI